MPYIVCYRLLNKKRESMEKVYSPDRMKWRQLPDSELLSHELHSTMADQVGSTYLPAVTPCLSH